MKDIRAFMSTLGKTDCFSLIEAPFPIVQLPLAIAMFAGFVGIHRFDSEGEANPS